METYKKLNWIQIVMGIKNNKNIKNIKRSGSKGTLISLDTDLFYRISISNSTEE